MADTTHVPPLKIVSVEPDTVQTEVVLEAKTTGRPDEAVACNVMGATPNATDPTALKLMDWLALTTLNQLETCGAAA